MFHYPASDRKKRQEAETNAEMFPDCCRFPGSGKNRIPETGLPRMAEQYGLYRTRFPTAGKLPGTPR